MRRLLAVFIVFLLVSGAESKAQQIIFGPVDPGPYGPGSSITVPVTVSGFKPGNRFELWMYKQDGESVSYQPIGTFDGHYTTFINGVIPADVQPGQHFTMQIRATDAPNPFDCPTAVDITDKQGPLIKVTPLEEKNLLKKDYVYGFCQGIMDGNTLTLADSSNAGATVKGSLYNDYDPTKAASPISIAPNALVDVVLGKSYYTARFRSELNGVVSTRSYVILNNDFNLNLQASGSQVICLKLPINPNEESEKLGYSIIIDSDKGIAKNYPGLLYNFDWGDGFIDHFTQEELITRGGVVKHHYNESSCGEAPIMINPPVYNAYKANVSITADFCTGASPQFTSYPRVFILPLAEFDVPPQGGCVGKDVTFKNNTTPGQSPNTAGTACTDLTTYRWYIKKSTESSWQIKSASQDFTYQFPEVGTYNVRLVASNNSCSPTEIIKDICISRLPEPKFEFTQSSGCGSALITTDNKTDVANLCKKSYLWQVIDSLSGAPVTDGITFIEADTSAAPHIQVDKPGNYILRLTVANSCENVVLDKPFLVAGSLAVTQPGEQLICKKIPVQIDFASESRLKPLYEGFGKNKTYHWTVTGGSYDFIDGSDTHAYPVIKFNEPGKKYKISIVYSNECGSVLTSNQDVTFYDMVEVDAGPDDVVCDNSQFPNSNTTYILHAKQPESYETAKWTILPGSPTASFAGNISNVYNATLTGLKPGIYNLRWTITNPGGCSESDDMVLKVYQKPVPGSGSGSVICSQLGGGKLSVCKGTNVNISTTPSSTGILIDWQYAPDKGSVPGASDWISLGNNSDNVTCNDIQQSTWFRYVLASKGSNDGCSTVAYSNPLKVPVDPPSFAGTINTANPTTYCEGTTFTGTLKLNGYISKVVGWEKSEDGGNSWTAITNTSDSYSYSNLAATTQFRAIVKSGECSVAFSDPVTITIDPRPSSPDAGAAVKLCLSGGGTTYQLHGNVPVVGTGTWSQPAGQTATIDNPSQNTTMVGNLEKGKRYMFSWTISNGTCAGTSDDMILDVLTDISNSVKADHPVSCPGEAVSLSTDILTGGDNSFVPADYSYRWESSIDNSTWTPVAGETLESLTVYPSITTWYKRIVKSHNSCEVMSAPVKVVVNATTPVSHAGSDVILCNATSYKMSANAPGSGFYGEWKDLAGGSTLTFSSVNDPNAVVSNLQPGNTYHLEWRIKGVPPCADEVSQVQIIVRHPATAASVSSPLTICLNNTASNDHIQLTGNQPSAANGESGSWALISGPSASVTSPSLYNSEVTGLQPGTYQFEWKVKNDATIGDAGCRESSAVLTVNVIPFPVKGTISPGNISVCKGADLGTLSLSAYSPSDVLQWQQSADNNNFTDIPAATQDAYSPGSMTQTTWYRVKFSQVAGCLNAVFSDPVKVQVDEPAEGGTTSGSKSRLCIGTNSVTISLSGEKGTVVRWEMSNDNFSSNSISVPGNSKNYTFHDLNQDTWFRAVVRNGACSEVYSSVTYVQVLPNVTVADAGADQYLCNELNISLHANTPSAGTGKWVQVNGPVVPISDNQSPVTNVGPIIPGTYVFRWEISNGICDPSIDDVTIYNYASLTNNITGSTTICSGQTASIHGDTPAGGNGSYIYQWQRSSDNNVWSDIPGETGENITAVFTSSAWLRRIVKSGPCSSVSNSVSVTVQPPVTNNNIGSDQVLCAGQVSSLLSGSSPSGGDGSFFYQWQKSTDQVVWTDIPGAVSPDFDPGLLSQTTSFRRIVTTALCSGDQKSVSNEVQIIVNPLPRAEFTTVRQKSCIPFDLSKVISLVPYDDRNATYEWFADGVSLGAGKVFPGYIIQHDGEMVTIKLVVTSKFGCGSDSRELTFETVKDVIASFTKDQVKGCGPLTVNFINTSIPLSGGTYEWNFGNGQTSTAVHPGAVVFDPSPSHRDTTYIITLKASTGCKETFFTDSVQVRPKPLAVFSPDKTWGCSPLEISLRNQSKGGLSSYTFDFGDGQTYVTNDTSSVTHTFYTTKTDTVTIRLRAENECGFDTTSYKILIYPNTVTPRLIVDGDRRFGCAPLTVRFDNHTEGANRFFWDFKDGSTTNTTKAPESVTHTFTVPGVYNVSLFATNGCSSGTDTKTITVFGPPDAGFSFNGVEHCVKDSVQFTSKPGVSASYNWNFDDGTTSTDANPRHAFLHAGKYNIQLTVLQSHPDGSVCSSSATQQVEILPLPVALFTSNATSVNCVPFRLSVTTTPANAAYVEWDFGDPAGPDNRMAGHIAEHVYDIPGTYKVKEIAYNESGCTDTIVKSIKILERPKALFSVQDTMICGTSATLAFNNESTYSGADAVVYKWLVDGRQVSVQKNLTYAFNVPANAVWPYRFEVKLVASSTLGCPDTVKHIIQFNPLPKAGFDINTNIGCAPFKVSLQNKSAYADTTLWYLDDVLVSKEKNPEIILTESNKTYTLRLKVTSQYGCASDFIEKKISTYERPKASFTLADSISCNGKLDIQVVNASIGATHYLWDFGDGSSPSNQATPQHLYGQAGVFKLRLIASNSFCSDTLTRSVFIAAPPQPMFVPSVSKGCTQLTVTFQNNSLHAEKYLWDFGDGTYSTASNPSHTFGYIRSPFTVRLTVTGEYGCQESAVQVIHVSAPPIADFAVLPDTVIKVPEYTFTFKNKSEGSGLKYRWNFGDGKTSDEENPVHTYLDNGVHSVKLIVTNSEGCMDTLIRKVRIDGVPGFLYVPSGFEPGSLKEDVKVFKPKGSGIARYSLKIFNIWGKLVWQSTKLDEEGSPAEGWDGNIDGAPASQGVYVWDINAIFLDGSEWKGMKYEKGPTKTVGPIHLIR